jgi:hypothetical protein
MVIIREISVDYIRGGANEGIARMCIERKQQLKMYGKETMATVLLIDPVLFYFLIQGLS